MEIWRERQKKTFTKLLPLMDFLKLDKNNRKKLFTNKLFRLQVPYRIAEKIPKNCLNNSLSLQYLPFHEEKSQEGFIDPVGDRASQKNGALLHKYDGRALLLTTGACAMHCRYCFRQNFPYKNEVNEAIEKIRNDLSIREVILSGGDPLSLSDKSLGEILKSLDKIDHVEIIRFHTRFLMAIPERVTDSLLDLLKRMKKQVIFVIHVNCKEEFDEDVFQALEKLGQLHIPIFSQSVLLKGVNDDYSSLYQLFFLLIKRGITPYYLHQLDKVKGSLHFSVSEEKGINLMKRLRDTLPGYAVPRFVKEMEGQRSKTIIF